MPLNIETQPILRLRIYRSDICPNWPNLTRNTRGEPSVHKSEPAENQKDRLSLPVSKIVRPDLCF